MNIITLHYILRTSLDKYSDLGFNVFPKLSKRHTAKKITDIDYADDLTLTAETITNAQTLSHRLEVAAKDVRLYVNVPKTQLINFNQQSTKQTISNEPIKTVDDFTCLVSEINSTEKDVKTRMAKA